MAAPRKYPVELKERATRLALEARKDPDTAAGALKRVASQCAVSYEALRTWVRAAEQDRTDTADTVTMSAAKAEIQQLQARVKELERANTILKQASAFFAAELRRPHL